MSNSNTAKPWEHAKSGAGSEADPLAARFVESISYDQRMYHHDIQGSIAHATMLEGQGLITADDLTQIKQGLEEIRQEIAEEGSSWAGWRVELEDVHMCVEAALIEKIGDAGRKLHTGRSRNDQVALDLKLWINDVSVGLSERFDTLLNAFVEVASREGEIVMPSFTHLQRAQPIVLGGELMAWVAAFNRCNDRLVALNGINKLNPIGSGAIAGSSLPLDRGVTASLLPLGDPTANSMDATASRDAAIDMIYALAMTSMTLSRWAEQWIIYASTEFSFLKVDDRYTTGSSMMPQKRNPDMLELIRGRSGNVYGNLMAALTMCKGITIGYNRDMQEDKRHLFAAYDIVSDCLDMAARIVSTIKFNGERIGDGLERGFLDATSLAEYLVSKGVPFRTGHQIVGALVRHCEAEHLIELSLLSVDQFNKHCVDAGQASVCENDIYDWLKPENVVKQYKSSGNAGLSGFKQQLEVWQQKLGQ